MTEVIMLMVKYVQSNWNPISNELNRWKQLTRADQNIVWA
jgi:hypothetical protein